MKDAVEQIRNQGFSSILRDVVHQNSIDLHSKRPRVETELSVIEDWDRVDESVESVVITANCMNDENLEVLDFTNCKNLRTIKVGDGCFMNVNTLNLTKMKNLESVVIGENSFTTKKNGFGKEPKRQFYLKNCPSLRELKVGRYSFSDYTVCEIDDMDALVTIVIGDLNADSYNFPFAFLTLRGWWDAKGDHP